MEIEQSVARLKTLCLKLASGRDIDIINDMYEAAWDWRTLGESLIEAKGHDLSGRVQQEVELFEKLRSHYGAKLAENPDYIEIMAIGEGIIEIGKRYKPPPDGYLGSARIIRETFAFLTSEFGMVPGTAPDASCNYASDHVKLELSLPNHAGAFCWIEPLDGSGRSFQLEQVLFMGGRFESLALPQGEKITTEAQVQAWFTTVANILRQYGSDLLANKPGAFEQLAEAAAERDRLIGEEGERLWRLEHPGEPIPTFS